MAKTIDLKKSTVEELKSYGYDRTMEAATMRGDIKRISDELNIINAELAERAKAEEKKAKVEDKKPKKKDV